MKMMSILTIALVSLLLCSTALSSGTKHDKKRRKPKDRPNFIVLFVDDLGYGDLGFTGHPTTKTPNIDRLAWNGKILTTWYSGCSVCTGSRSALMTGRQWPRTGLPNVLDSTSNMGLPLNETTVAEQLKRAGYATGIVGKWHLGQRSVYLPGNRGFDYYLGIPYSVDMGNARATSCTDKPQKQSINNQISRLVKDEQRQSTSSRDPAGDHLPLVYQEFNRTKIVQQPLDFAHLAEKYNSFAIEYIKKHSNQPFFLYMPFSHVHTTSNTQPEKQYAGCMFKNSTTRGSFGDALAEADWIIGNIHKTVSNLGIEENTVILFTSDNGPWMIQGLSGGSEGIFTGRYAGYWNTGKASTWEGGVRMPAFAYWKGQINPFSRSSEIVSSLDVFPTLSTLAGVPLPTNRVYDGKDMSQILLQDDGKSEHDFLFLYGTCNPVPYYSVTAVRHGKYKAHWCTSPGHGQNKTNTKLYHKYPLLFDVERDPSEAEPISKGDEMPIGAEDRKAMERILRAYATETSTFQFGKLIPEPDGPNEQPGKYGICCDRSRGCDCTSDASSPTENMIGILNLGTKQHHDLYHEILGEKEPTPPRTRAQKILQNR